MNAASTPNGTLPFVYTLVAYRPNGIDTCRGCLMGSSDSDFTLDVYASAEELAEAWAGQRFAENGRGREYCSFDYVLLLNGRDDQHDPDWEDVAYLNDAGEHLYEKERKRVEQLVDAAYARLVDERKQQQEREAAQQESLRLAAALRERQAAEAHERAELARLQAKFGGQS